MYIITFSLSLAFLYMSENKNKYIKPILVFAGLLIPSILAGIRDYTVGNDVLLYGNVWFEQATQFNSLIDYLSKAHEYSIGIGYAFVNYIISRITYNNHFFYFIYELLQLTILYFALKKYENKISIAFAFAVYYFSYYNLSLSMLRQIMAMILILYSFRYLDEGNNIKYILNIIVAYSFHSSAIVGIVLLPIKRLIENKEMKTIFKVIIIASCLLIILFYQQIFIILGNLGLSSLERYTHYLTDSEVGGRFIRIGYWGIITLLILSKSKYCKLYFEQSEFLQMILFISMICSMVMFIGSTWIIRLAYYFDVFQILYLPILAKNLGVVFGNSKRKAGYLVLISLLILNWLITFVIRNGASTYPFVFMK